ncbi:MAG: NAD(P)H-binding protein [Bacteroidales bacterium]|nr:NAD(P)H-binding protein [Bacteroidales bacterium]
MNKRTAIVFGATGLVGSYLLDELVKTEIYERILVFSRKNLDIQNSKVDVVVHNLVNIDEIENQIRGNDLFCCLGTTIKKAGSQEVFKKVDLRLPAGIARIAFANGVKNFAVVSSIGAKATVKNFYLSVKGLMEQEIMKYPFENLIILRPSLLLGERKEFRFGEGLAKFFMPLFSPLLRGKYRKYRPVHGRDVAKAMINLVLFPRKQTIFESDEIHDISNTIVE